MNRLRAAVGFALTLALLLSVGCGEEAETPVIVDSLSVVLADWKEWAESSSDGLWEGDPRHALALSELSVYGGDFADPPFYSVESFVVSGDTLFVADQGAQQLVAMSADGRVLWKSGEPGEGPGYFAGVSQVAIGKDIIAVANLPSARVDLFTRDGMWANSVPAMSPYDILLLGDTALVVASLANPEELITIHELDGSKISAFGVWDHPTSRLPGCNRHLHIAALNDSLLVVTSYYANHLQVFDLATGHLLRTFSRDLPAHIREPDFHTEDGATHFFLETFLLDVFVGPEGMVNVLLRPFSTARTTDLTEEGLANVCLVDRFNWEGHYLDSYAVPVAAGQMAYLNGTLYASDEWNCTIRTYEVRVGESL